MYARWLAINKCLAPARVVVNDMSPAGAEAVTHEIQTAGGEAMAWTCSVTDRAAVEAMVAGAVERWGSVDILVNNAGNRSALNGDTLSYIATRSHFRRKPPHAPFRPAGVLRRSVPCLSSPRPGSPTG